MCLMCVPVPGVDPRVALPSTALAPGDDSYLGEGLVLLSSPDHGASTVSLAGVQHSLVISSTHHVLRDLTGAVPGVQIIVLFDLKRRHYTL